VDRNVTRVPILHNSKRLFFACNGAVLRPSQLGFGLRVSRKPAPHPYKAIATPFHTSTYLPNAVEVWPHAQSRFCCPARHHFKAIPTSLRPSHVSCRFHPTWNTLTAGGVLRRRWDLRSYLRSLSPHAVGLTPGPHQVLMPFFFPDDSGLLLIIRGSACIPPQTDLSLNQTLPAMPVRSPFTRLHHSLYATACGFGKHPWLGKTRTTCEPSRYRVGASSARVLPHEPAPSLHIR